MQLEGRATEITGEDESTGAPALRGEVSPSSAPGRLAPAAIVQALAKVRWYRLQAERLYFIDNSLGFGHRELVELGRR